MSKQQAYTLPMYQKKKQDEAKEDGVQHQQQLECVRVHQNPVGKSYRNALPMPKTQSFAVVKSACADAGRVVDVKIWRWKGALQVGILT